MIDERFERLEGELNTIKTKHDVSEASNKSGFEKASSLIAKIEENLEMKCKNNEGSIIQATETIS